MHLSNKEDILAAASPLPIALSDRMFCVIVQGEGNAIHSRSAFMCRTFPYWLPVEQTAMAAYLTVTTYSAVAVNLEIKFLPISVAIAIGQSCFTRQIMHANK